MGKNGGIRGFLPSVVSPGVGRRCGAICQPRRVREVVRWDAIGVMLMRSARVNELIY